ncbi:MAG: PDZ domain-containing protein [Phycisphaerales bacterium]|jgi:hypothetical protein|nr:PDZ domain-containing protein [Phycisphaerales bacterium]
MRGCSAILIGVLAGLCMWTTGCAPSLSENFRCTLPGGDSVGRSLFGIARSDHLEVVTLKTTGINAGEVLDAEMERFDAYLNKGLIPIGDASSRSAGQGVRQAEVLAAQHGASVVVVEIRDPPPFEKTIETQVPRLVTESVRVHGTANFEGNVTRIGWGPGTTRVWVDPYFIDCRLWGKRSWPPPLGVYFTKEMRAFRGHSDVDSSPTMKTAADRWRLRHPGQRLPPQGAEISRILPKTAAERIGLRCRDILMSIDGQSISNEAAARSAIHAAAGYSAVLVIMRQSGNKANDEAEGWSVTLPENPLFQGSDPAPWRQLTRSASLAPSP